MDKRRSPRKSVKLSIKLTYPSGDSQLVHTRDISDSGVFLILDKLDKPSIGELVTVELLDDIQNTEVFPSSEAIVVRQESEGIGLAFIEMDFAMGDDSV
jgi:PilZ domain